MSLNMRFNNHQAHVLKAAIIAKDSTAIDEVFSDGFDPKAKLEDESLQEVNHAGGLLHFAVLNDCPQAISLLLQIDRTLADDLNTEQDTALMVAARKGSLACLEAILEDVPCAIKQNALHFAVIYDRFEFIRPLLTKNKELATSPDILGDTPISLTTRRGKLEYLKQILACYAPDNNTALHYAALYGNITMLTQLASTDDVNATNAKHQSVLDFAQTIDKDPLSGFSKKQDTVDAMVEILVRAGAPRPKVVGFSVPFNAIASASAATPKFTTCSSAAAAARSPITAAKPLNNGESESQIDDLIFPLDEMRLVDTDGNAPNQMRKSPHSRQ